MNYIFTIFLILSFNILSLVGMAQRDFVYFETTNNKKEVCQNKSIGVIANISENYQEYISYEWSGDSTSFREAKNEIAIVNTSTPGEKNLKFTLILSNEKRLDTTFIITVMPTPEVIIFKEKGRVFLKEDVQHVSSIKWIYNKTILPENNALELKNPQIGTYHVVITDNNGCAGLSQPLTIN